MKIPSLYRTTNEAESLYRQLLESVDEETGEVDSTISNALTVKQDELRARVITVGQVYRMIAARIVEAKAEINRLKEIQQRDEKLLARLEQGLSGACNALGEDRIESLDCNISFTHSQSVDPYDESQIPAEYWRKVEKYEVDKAKIGAAIKAGKEVPGARLQYNTNIKIK